MVVEVQSHYTTHRRHWLCYNQAIMSAPSKQLEFVKSCRRLMADMERLNYLGSPTFINAEPVIALALNLAAHEIEVKLLSRHILWRQQGGVVSLAVSLDDHLIGMGGCGGWKALANRFYKRLDSKSKFTEPTLVMDKVEVLDLDEMMSKTEPGIREIIKQYQEAMKEGLDAIILTSNTPTASGPSRSRRM